VQPKEGANYLNNPRPEYPRVALREGWQGKVILKVKVLPDGKVGGAVVQQSAGHDVLDEACLDIVKKWMFVPATQGGKPIAGWVSVPFEFNIK
jgi:protein TonB